MDQTKKRPNLAAGCLKFLILFLVLLVLLVIAVIAGALGYRQVAMNQGTPNKLSCSYNGVEYKDGENFDASDGCNTCLCGDGAVACTDKACSEPDGGENPAPSCTEYICREDLPEVYYKRPGLLSAADKTELTKKVLNPYMDYYSTNESILLGIMVEVPDTVGKPFIIDGFFEGGAHEGFLHNKRGGPIDWWVPVCLDECTFTDEFEAKYPEIVELSTP